jgi:peroxiredoxin
MKKPTNLTILLYLILAAFAFEVFVLARQNMLLKRQLYSGLAQQKGNDKEIKEGMILPSLSLKNFENKEFTFSYNRPGEYTLLYFFSLTCPQCMRNIPQWRRLTEELAREKSVRVMGVCKGNVPDVKQYADGYNLNYAAGAAALNDTTIVKSYGISYVPTTVLVDDSARVIWKYVGVLSDDKRQEILNRIYGNTTMN